MQPAHISISWTFCWGNWHSSCWRNVPVGSVLPCTHHRGAISVQLPSTCKFIQFCSKLGKCCINHSWSTSQYGVYAAAHFVHPRSFVIGEAAECQRRWVCNCLTAQDTEMLWKHMMICFCVQHDNCCWYYHKGDLWLPWRYLDAVAPLLGLFYRGPRWSNRRGTLLHG